MIKQLKRLTVRLIEGANIATCAVMIMVGFSGILNPESHPHISQAGLVFPILLAANILFLFFWLLVRWRSAWIPILGLLLCYQPLRTYLPINFGDDAPEGSIKVLSYNAQAFTGVPRYDSKSDEAKEKIVNYIKKQDADIVCIQEVLGTKKGYEEIDKLYPYHDLSRLGSTQGNATAFYSRYPIKRKETIEYASRANGSTAYYIDVDGREVIVVNNHLESNHLTMSERQQYADIVKGEAKGDTMRQDARRLFDKLASAAMLRAPQARAVADFVSRHLSQPLIVCGDFNDNPLSYTHRQIADGLTDCYVETALGPGFSYNQKKFLVRIDNVLCSEVFTPYKFRIDRSIDASDHYPIVGWLKMSKNH